MLLYVSCVAYSPVGVGLLVLDYAQNFCLLCNSRKLVSRMLPILHRVCISNALSFTNKNLVIHRAEDCTMHVFSYYSPNVTINNLRPLFPTFPVPTCVVLSLGIHVSHCLASFPVSDILERRRLLPCYSTAVGWLVIVSLAT